LINLNLGEKPKEEMGVTINSYFNQSLFLNELFLKNAVLEKIDLSGNELTNQLPELFECLV